MSEASTGPDYSKMGVSELLTSIFHAGKRIAMAEARAAGKADIAYYQSELPKMTHALQELGHRDYPGISTAGIAQLVLRWAGEVAPMNLAVQNDIVDQLRNITALDNASWSRDSTMIDGQIASLIGMQAALRDNTTSVGRA